MLELRNICKKYDRDVLKKINLKFGNRGLICLVGESGSGKSTLLNIIGGLEEADSGKVLIDGVNINKFDSSYYHNQVVSYINQNYNLIDYYSTLDNTLLPIDIRRNRSPCFDNKIFKMLGISSLKNIKVSSLSGGEKKRVAIARCMVQNTKIILADEPTGALDLDNSYKIMEILKNFSKKKLVIVVTHNMELANKFADEIIKLIDGKIEVNIKKQTRSYFNLRQKNEVKLTISKLCKYAVKNMKNKLLRNVLVVLAFTIGLCSLGLVLSIRNGFKKELDNLNGSSFFNYPIIISKSNYVDDFNSKIENIRGINVKKGTFINNVIDDKLINIINDIDKKYVKAVSYYRDIDYNFKSVSYVNPSNNYFYILDGKWPENDNEVLILYDEDNSISEKVYNYLDVENKGLINNIFYVNGKELKVCGVVRSNNDYFKDLSGIIYSNNLFDNEILDIFIYSSDLESKNIIKDKLKDYNILDNAEDIVNNTKKIVDGISIVLILFSVISLIVSVIMIFVISYISVIERYKDIGVYKSIGFRNKDVKNLFCLENILIGVCSFVYSNVTLILIGNKINDYVSSYVNINKIMVISFSNVLIIGFLSIFLCYIASLIPACIASKKKIIDVMNN